MASRWQPQGRDTQSFTGCALRKYVCLGVRVLALALRVNSIVTVTAKNEYCPESYLRRS